MTCDDDDLNISRESDPFCIGNMLILVDQCVLTLRLSNCICGFIHDNLKPNESYYLFIVYLTSYSKCSLCKAPLLFRDDKLRAYLSFLD